MGAFISRFRFCRMILLALPAYLSDCFTAVGDVKVPRQFVHSFCLEGQGTSCAAATFPAYTRW